MKNIFFLIILVLILVTSHAKEIKTSLLSCKIVQNFPKHEELNERSFSIQFPDGRKFIVIGDDHGDPSLKASLLTAINQTTLSNKDYLESIHNIIIKLIPTLKHYKEELSYLRSQGKSFRFIAIERPPDYFNVHQGNIDWFYKTMNQEFKKRGILNSTLQKELTLLYSGPAYYLKLTNKNQTSQQILYADDDSVFDQLSLMKEKSEYVQQVEQILKKSDFERYRNEIEKLRDQMYEYYWTRGIGFTDEVLNKIENVYLPEKLNLFPQELRKKLNILLRDDLAIAKVMIAREKTMVRTLLSSYQSVIFTVGLQHLKNLSLELESECQSYLNRVNNNYSATTYYDNKPGTK